MTAKPKLMAGQTDSADDLIAELARLMAEDAQSDKPTAPPARPVRVPGSDAPVRPALSVETQADNRPIRIPGNGAPAPEPTVFSQDRSQRPAAPAAPAESFQRKEPFAFSFEPRPIETPQREPAPQQAPSFVEPVVTAPEPAEAHLPEGDIDTTPSVAEPMPALDQDSLADLIAAELAVPEEPEAVAEPVLDEPVVELDVTDDVPRENFPKEVDSFGIPPVFGLGTTPVEKPEVHTEASETVIPEVKLAQFDLSHEMFVPPPHHKSEPLPDPLEEIERLIGPAARVHQKAPAPSPALRSLATPTLPKAEPAPSAVPVQPAKVSSIEEAILAAAATSGAKVEWVEPAISARLPDEDDEPVAKAPRGRILGMTRSLAGPLVATLLLAVAAVGLYTVLGLGTSTPEGPAPLVAADTTPTKEVPEPTETADANQSVVFNEISGANTAATEQIVSRDQADVEAVTEVAASDVNAEGLVNRKVRTVTVRPDGTIVSGGDSLAGSAMLPVDRPTVPDVPGADFSTPDMIANANAAASTPAAAETPAVAPTPAVTPVQPGSTVPAVDLAGNPIAGKTAPVPLARPSNLGTQNAASTSAPLAATPVQQPQAAATPVAAQTPIQTPATTTAAAATPAITAPSGAAAPAYVQLSSQRSEEAARQSAQSIASRFGSMFNGANLEVQRVDLGKRGIFYRVRVPADSIQSANAICSNIKASGGDCYTL